MTKSTTILDESAIRLVLYANCIKPNHIILCDGSGIIKIFASTEEENKNLKIRVLRILEKKFPEAKFYLYLSVDKRCGTITYTTN